MQRLEDPTISVGERRRLFNELCKTCSRHRMIPRSMHIPDCSGAAIWATSGGYADISRSVYEGRQVAVKVARVYDFGLDATLSVSLLPALSYLCE